MAFIETKPLLDRDEDEETLSLCDLAVNNTDEYYLSDFSSSSQSQDHHHQHKHNDMFEFARQNFTSKQNNVVFCGKIITYKEGGEEMKMEKKKKKKRALSSSSKLRWYFITFGSFGSARMDMRDIRRRQSRRREVAPPSPPPSSDRDGGEKRSGKTLWRLLAILGCKK